MKGDCARDKLGRPVIASIGMLHGTVEDMEKQLVYVTPSAGGGAPHQCPQVNQKTKRMWEGGWEGGQRTPPVSSQFGRKLPLPLYANVRALRWLILMAGMPTTVQRCTTSLECFNASQL